MITALASSRDEFCYARSTMIKSAFFTYLSKVFGLALASRILIASEGFGFTIPPAGKVFKVPTNL